ncbi:HAD family hydrolase [Candidatus Saccharibacteria bacterium]|nr:HAD family hydrolase [Candidatus Saccharibacteria bacterium]
MKKIVFSDYDGTIYTDDGNTTNNVAAIKKWHAAGGKFVIATGRGFTSAQDAAGEYGIPFDYCIMNNGALIADSNWTLISELTIDPPLAQEIAEFVQNNFAAQIEGLYYYGLGSKSHQPTGVITKIRVQTHGRNHEPMLRIAKALNHAFPDVIAHATLTDMYPLEQFPDANYQIVDIVGAKAGKERSIQLILERESLSPDDVITIGDGANDVEMLEQYDGYAIRGSMAAQMTTGKTVASLADMLSTIENSYQGREESA